MLKNTGGSRRLLLLSLLSLAFVTGGCSSSNTIRTMPTSVDLVNLSLGPDYSHWLVGPIALMATSEEIARYLSFDSDEQARPFIRQFWAARNPEPGSPLNELRDQFERRAEDADRKFTEGTSRGRRTDRGVIYVLYGEPESVSFEVGPVESASGLEVWTYPSDAEAGLNGSPVRRIYRFYKPGELTVIYRPVVPSDPLARRSRRGRSG